MTRTKDSQRGLAPMTEASTGRADWAVIRTGGKQFRVCEGESLVVDRSDFIAAASSLAPGDSTFVFDEVLAVQVDGVTVLGDPAVAGAQVVAEVLPETRGPKVLVLKKRRRKNSRRKAGHRQPLQPIRIRKIEVQPRTHVPSLDDPERLRSGLKLADTTGPFGELHAMLSALRSENPARQAQGLRWVIGTKWSIRDRVERIEAARAVEGLLLASDGTEAAEAAVALAVIDEDARGSQLTPEDVGQRLTRYFAERRRRFFADAAVERLVPPDGSAGSRWTDYRARASLRQRLDLSIGGKVQLARSGLESLNLEIRVSGLGVDTSSVRTTLRTGCPEDVLIDALVEFRNDAAAGTAATLDFVASGRRLERRVLALQPDPGRGLSRDTSGYYPPSDVARDGREHGG